MANDLRYRRLVTAKMAGLSRDYPAAYALMDTLLGQFPDDAEVHRLYGNILELDAFSEEVVRPTDARLRRARQHYRHLMKVGEGGYMALFDLAEHFSNVGKLSVAESLFHLFVKQCEGRPAAECEDELESSLDWLRWRAAAQ